jgi:hypothetical protein
MANACFDLDQSDGRQPQAAIGTFCQSRSIVRCRRNLAVAAPFRRRAGVAPIEPVGNGGSPIDGRPSPSTPLGFQRLRTGQTGFGRSCPRPWKNVLCDESEAACFPAVTVETPV